MYGDERAHNQIPGEINFGYNLISIYSFYFIDELERQILEFRHDFIDPKDIIYTVEIDTLKHNQEEEINLPHFTKF